MKKILAEVASSIIFVCQSFHQRQSPDAVICGSCIKFAGRACWAQWAAQARAATVGHGWTYLRYDADRQRSWTRWFQRN